LTIIVVTEVNDNALAESKKCTLEFGDRVALFNVTKGCEKLASLRWGNDRSELALDEEYS
jgi:hypothetical protein